MNSINNNPFRNSNINMENNNILNNTSPKMKKIDKFEQPIAKNFLNKIKEEIAVSYTHLTLPTICSV